MSLSILAQRFDTFINLLTNKVKRSDGGSLLAKTASLNAGASAQFDLAALLPEGTTLADYYMQTAIIDLKIIDSDSASAYNGQAVTALATMSYGLDANGLLTIRNDHTAALTYWLRVTSPALK